MDLDPELMKKLLITFSAELDEQCQIITQGLLALEKNENVQPIIESIFRSAHNIKGAARGIGIKDVGEIAHHIESIFAKIQNKSLAISPHLIDRCLQAVDNMHIGLQAFIDKKTLPFDLNEFLLLLSAPESLENKPIKTTDTSVANETTAIKNAEKPVDRSEPLKKDPIKQSSNATQIKMSRNEQESIRVSIENLDHVSALAEEIQVTKIAIDDHYNGLTELSSKMQQFEILWKEMGFTINNISTNNSTQNIQELFNENSDNLIEVRNTFEELYKTMRAQVNNLALLSNSLLEEVRTIRLIPASTLFNSFPRAARDIAHELNKQVEIHITGDTVKMDQMILEGLKDPIMHLLRNAIDHGIETPLVRQEKGKMPSGQINIHIQEQGDHILIELSDDGAGIDIQSIANAAIHKQLITEVERKTMSDETLLELIFRPGFSTKDTVTDVSGRGVGLDVVKSNIDALKGHVRIKTEINKGTTFYISVPLTLASERGLLIQSSGQLFVIPTNLVERVLIEHPDNIIDIEGSQAILFNTHPIPLRTLSDILNLPRKDLAKKNSLPIVVLKKGWNTVALFVEEIINEREIVIKRLQPPLMNVPCVSGGTLAGNGEVIIVLNSNDIIDHALHLQKSSPITLSMETEVSQAPLKPHILVVDDSITTRTLEKNILENKNYQVTVAVNGKEAWDLLQQMPFSLLITDINMPIMDGFTLTERVKQSDKLRDLPVIIVTSLGSETEKKRGIDAGANAYIVKNEFESEKLLQIVSQLV
ncbi:MAG: hybrid sensor histidine kinase/response regulator [Gammaproteobacteria bacterium]|nr:hybrid sensor histidine kinase/response regulator [Gammaproteobacteria bacterium]